MRSPENVLESLKSKACNKSYKYERLYRNLYNPQFYLLAYQRIQAKPGNMTAGTDGKTIDGMGMARINALIEKMRDFSYQPNPARRTYIPKSNGKMRPLGIPSFDDKLIQEVVRLILESIYEPTFSDYSHGFRINRSCHTALKYVQKYFTGTKGSKAGVHGSIQNRSYEDKQGNRRTVTEIIADEVEFLSRKVETQAPAYQEITDNELPF